MHNLSRLVHFARVIGMVGNATFFGDGNGISLFSRASNLTLPHFTLAGFPGSL
jgi:hypothetical protein